MRVGWLASFGVGVIVVCAGCKREAMTSYQAPKEDYSVKPLSMPGMAMGGGAGGGDEERAPSVPQLKWELPKGWVEKTGQQKIGVGAFHVEGEDGKYADIRVIPLRAGPEIEQRSVNMWREELGLAELPMDAVKGEEIDVAGARGHFYDLKSEELRFWSGRGPCGS